MLRSSKNGKKSVQTFSSFFASFFPFGASLHTLDRIEFKRENSFTSTSIRANSSISFLAFHQNQQISTSMRKKSWIPISMKRIIKWILKDFFLLLQRWENKIGKSFISDCVAAWMGKRGNCWGFLHRRRKIHDEHNSHNRKPAQLNNPPRILDNFPSNFPEVFPRMCSSGAVQSCWNSAKTRRFHDVNTLCWMYFHHTIVGLFLHSVQCWRCVVVGRQARHGEKWKVWMNGEARGMKSRKLWIITRATLRWVGWGPPLPPLYDVHAVSGKSVKIILNS